MLGTGTMYAFSVLFLLTSKVLLMEINRKHGVGVWGLILFSLAEVLIVSVIYISITLLVKQDGTTLEELFPRALFCIFLILLIPYIIAYLFGYAHGQAAVRQQDVIRSGHHDGLHT